MSMQGVAQRGGSVVKRFGNLPVNRVAAAILWVASAYTTSLLIEMLRTGGSPVNAAASASLIGMLVGFVGNSVFLAAIVLQFVFTIGERSIWLGKGMDEVAGIALLLDVVTNAAAVYPLARNFGATNIWTMLQDVFHFGQFSAGGALLLALVWGIIAAAGPEKLWSRK